MRKIRVCILPFLIWRKIRNLLLTKRYGFTGKHISFGKCVSIPRPKYISIGNYVTLDDYSELCVSPSISGIKPQLILGNRVSLGKFTRIGCDNLIIIEDDVITAPHVHISDRDHGYEDLNTPISTQRITTKGPVIIGAETWLSFGCQIMSGVKIGRHCVVAAGAVVTKDVPDYSVVGGNPAKILRRYSSDTGVWESTKKQSISSIKKEL